MEQGGNEGKKRVLIVSFFPPISFYMERKLLNYMDLSPECLSGFYQKKTKKFCFCFVFFVLSLTLVSCNKELSQPELKDPIYKDLLKEQKKYEDLAIDTEIQFRKLETEKKKWEARSLKRALSKKNFYKLKKQWKEYTQWAQYYKLRAISRLRQDRKSYKEAFRKGKVWPPPEEYRLYLIEKKLKNAPRKWTRKAGSSMEKEDSEKQKASSHH